MTATADTLTPDDITATQEILRDTYSSTRADMSDVMVADGYGVTLDVRDGQLVVRDGIGQHRRIRQLTRVERRVRRIVVLGSSGSISLAAVRWCSDVGVDVVQLDRDGTILGTVHAVSHTDARLIRAQAMSVATGLATAIAADLLRLKIAGHAVNAERLGAIEVANSLSSMADMIGTLDTSAELRELEARAADLYFSAWVRNVSAQFALREQSRIPEHWAYFSSRKSLLFAKHKSPNRASDPVNAMLNYAYALGEAECRRACVILGMEPTLGVLHADIRGRDSLALDLLETIRPIIESSVLDMLAARRFRYVDFIETPDGQCRLTESVTHDLAKLLSSWARAVAPYAEQTAHAFVDSATGDVLKRTPLTKTNRLRSAVKPAVKAKSSPTGSCHGCGTTELPANRKWCDACWAPRRAATAATSLANRQRVSGTDPSQTPEAKAKRRASLSRERVAREEWNTAHPEPVNPETYRREIQPALVDFPISAIRFATGISDSAASRIRKGTLTPHPRHWPTLANLVTGTITPPPPRKNQHG